MPRELSSRLRPALVFGLGFFSLVAQTLLFRDFLTAFEGNELGVGSFFTSWLLWVGVGALLGRLVAQRTERGPDLCGLALLYVPAFLLQHVLLLDARRLAGVSAYEAFPFGRMFAASLLLNAPVSFTTGLLFTLACRWAAGGGPGRTATGGSTRSERDGGPAGVDDAPPTPTSADSATGGEERPPGRGLPVALVYVLETLGSFVGGLVVTALLAGGLTAERVVLLSAVVLCVAVFVTAVAERRRWASVATLVAAGGLAAASLGRPAEVWHRWSQLRVWTRLFPAEQFRGDFATAQARYLYGQREGQFVVVSWGGVSEALPNTEHASEVVAIGLSQQPDARRVLVVGPGSLGICLRLLRLPQVERTVWLDLDPQYPTALRRVLPKPFVRAAERVEAPGVEVRRFLQTTDQRFDLVILNVPDATTLVLNRYWTQDFFRLVRRVLADRGVVCARLSGGANFMGGELVLVGASALQTVRSVFRHVVLKPGDETWLVASDSGHVTDAPAVLRDRFAAVPGAASVYPPEGLLSLYPPDRIQFQLQKYRQAAQRVGTDVLLNTDRRPKALLFSLLLVLRKALNVSLAPHVSVLLVGGLWMALCPAVFYGLLRWVYLVTGGAAGSLALSGGTSWRKRRAADVGASDARVAAGFDAATLVFLTGLTGMALSVLVLFLYQSAYGTLFLHIGLLSSLFMLGTFVGSSWCGRVAGRWRAEPRWFLPVVLTLHLLVLAAVSHWPQVLGVAGFAVLMVLCGVFVGVYFPLAAFRLKRLGLNEAAAGARLELLDHVGGAAGALLAGWFLLPVLGTTQTAVVLAAAVAANWPASVVWSRTVAGAERLDRWDRLVRPAGYVLAGVVLTALAASHVAAAAAWQQSERLLQSAAQQLAGDCRLTQRRADVEAGSSFVYWELRRANEGAGQQRLEEQPRSRPPGEPTSGEELAARPGPDGYVFPTAPLTSGVSGYAGPVELAVRVDSQGRLVGLQVVRSRETPSYLKLVEAWFEQLVGRNVFDQEGLQGVDTVSGATITSRAVLRTLRQAGPRFAAVALGRGTAEPAEVAARGGAFSPRRPDVQLLALVLLLTAAVLVRRRPNVWVRRTLLLTTLVLTGFLWNLQYSTQHVAALLSGHWPSDWLAAPLLLLLGVPLVVLLFGNVYCGYVCPFGALQELVGELRPRGWETDPRKSVWRYGRAVKYVLLALLLVLFALTRRYDVFVVDPLLTVFSSARDHSVLAFSLLLVGLSVVFRRFWCRSLCPAGAFLSLLCGLKPVGSLRAPTATGRCDLGVRTARELDCLCCDRCRHGNE